MDYLLMFERALTEEEVRVLYEFGDTFGQDEN